MVEISTGNTSEISTSNTPKSHDFKEKSSFFSDIALPEISTVEISGGNKNLKFEKFVATRNFYGRNIWQSNITEKT